MAGASAVQRQAVLLSLAAALLWASYYPLVLWAKPGASPAATVVYPFLFGGIAYSATATFSGSGRVALRLWSQPMAWVRTGLLVGMQMSVLAGTYLAGPIDTSLLSLLGDVVITPLLVAFLWASHRGQIGTAWFTAGLVLSLAGGSLTIVGGRSLAAVQGAGWLVVPAVPITVAVYFLLTAQENERTPVSAVVAQGMVSAALLSAVLSPWVPGGLGSLGTVSPLALGLLAATGFTSFWLAPQLYFRAIRLSGMVIPPMLMTGIPVFTLVLSTLLLGLGVSWLAVLGVPVAVAGAVLTLRGESPSAPPPGGPAKGSAASSGVGGGSRPR